MRRSRHLMSALAVAGLLLAGCAPESDSAKPTPAFSSIEGYRSQKADWGACDSEWFIKKDRFSSAFKIGRAHV